MAVVALERKRRARPYVERAGTHTGRNLVFAGLAAATVQLMEVPVVMPLARLVERRRWGLVRSVRPSWLRDLSAILLLDYTLFLWHRAAHQTPWLWRFHLVHHVDLDLDASTGLRFHPGELALSVPWRAAQVAAIGVTPRALSIWQTLTLMSVLFHHSNSRLGERVERMLSVLFTTPAMHAIHHSTDDVNLQSNFSSGLAIWDHLHRTARLRSNRGEAVVIGVPGHLSRDQVRLIAALQLPFLRDSARSDSR